MYNTVVSARLSSEALAYLDHVADYLGRSRSACLSLLLEDLAQKDRGYMEEGADLDD